MPASASTRKGLRSVAAFAVDIGATSYQEVSESAGMAQTGRMPLQLHAAQPAVRIIGPINADGIEQDDRAGIPGASAGQTKKGPTLLRASGLDNSPAVTYSPTWFPMQYHRR